MTSFEDFKQQLVELQPGERVVYHIGRLAEDRQRQSSVHKIAILCRGLELMGRARLTSQRLDAKQNAYYLTLERSPSQRLQAKDVTRAWTLGQESLPSQVR